jgi:hypothetical protein
VLSLISGQHKSIATFPGWNLIDEGGWWIFVTVLKPGQSITVEDIPNREKFIIGVTSGMAKLHSLGIGHVEFSLDIVGIDEDGWRLIAGFGLIPAGEDKRFSRDAQVCETLFQQLVGRDWMVLCEFLCQETNIPSFEEFLQRVRKYD